VRLIAKTIGGNLFAATKRLNELVVVPYVFNMTYIPGADITIVVFKTESYPEYRHFCKR
jgi:hypothetical protein